METINFVIAVPLGIIALFFLLIGWRRGIRFNFHDYQGNKKERLRDNFFSSFAIISAISCIFPIISPIKSWFEIIPISLLIILVGTPVSMLGAYWSSFLANAVTRGSIRNRFFGQNSTDSSTLDWYEFTPFAYVVGWIVYYLIYAILLLSTGFKITSENAPVSNVLIGLVFGVIATVVVTINIYRKSKNASHSG